MPKINLETARKIIGLLSFAVAVFALGFFAGQNISIEKSPPRVTISRALPANRQTLDFGLFWKVWDTLEASYYDSEKIVPYKMVYGAISGLVGALGDPYTVFLPPEENKIVQEDLGGNFDGVGIQIGYRGTQLAVIAPLPGTPAEKAGVKAGDFIIGIKDEKKGIDRGTVGISLPEAVQLIRGQRGSKVILTLLREGVDEPITAEITRENINVPSVVVSYVGKEGELAHIRLLKFGGETNGEWERAVNEIAKNPKVKGIALDVRNNPGGYLQGAVDIVGEFVKTGSVAVIEEGKSGKEEFKTTRVPRLSGYPLVVLINKGSASASEILAGAMRDVRGVKLVGETSFGKGTIQEPQQVNGGAGLHITIAKWLTPDGIWVNEKGLEPDFEVQDRTETVEDEPLLKAIEILNGQI